MVATLTAEPEPPSCLEEPEPGQLEFLQAKHPDVVDSWRDFYSKVFAYKLAHEEETRGLSPEDVFSLANSTTDENDNYFEQRHVMLELTEQGQAMVAVIRDETHAQIVATISFSEFPLKNRSGDTFVEIRKGGSIGMRFTPGNIQTYDPLWNHVTELIRKKYPNARLLSKGKNGAIRERYRARPHFLELSATEFENEFPISDDSTPEEVAYHKEVLSFLAKGEKCLFISMENSLD